ncbi:MAG: SMP-30/gluconolactonase/LRE family protein [Steroidobacteraceae bacterium]
MKDGFDGTEGPVPQEDGSLLFTENRAGRIVRIAPDGSSSVWMDKTGGANALALTPKGEVVATLTGPVPAIAMLTPGSEPKVLVKDYQGTPFNRPNDLVVGKGGAIYFTDPVGAPAPGAAPPATPKKSSVYQLTAAGELLRIADDIETPNGIALARDERKLFVANTASQWVVAFALDRDGNVGRRSNFARLQMPQAAPAAQGAAPAPPPGSGADGVAVDDKNRVYVATTLGVQVFSPDGEPLGIISFVKPPQNLAFAGRKNRAQLYVLGRGSVYVIDTTTRGPRRPGK